MNRVTGYGASPMESLANRKRRDCTSSTFRESAELLPPSAAPEIATPARSDLRAAMVLLCLLAVIYNAALAVINSSLVPLSQLHVIGAEFAILSLALAWIVWSKSLPNDTKAFAFLAFFGVNAILVSLLSQSLYLDMIRNASVIAIFLMIGFRADWRTIDLVFRCSAILIGLVLLLEILSLETYAQIFAPADYYWRTRGIGASATDEAGLFRNALGWADRFSIIRIIEHRASSLYLEQVSLGNFSIVLAIFLCSSWEKIPTNQRIFYILLVALIVITTASRLALALTIIAPLIRWLGPKLGSWLSLLAMPATLGLVALIVATQPTTKEDNLVGRLNYTIQNLVDTTPTSALGFNADKAAEFADSGYVFLIYGTSVFGLIAFWFFVSFLMQSSSDAGRRCALYTSLYIFACLAVSGTSVFSIKTAALLWLLVGFCHRLSDQQRSAHRVGTSGR